MNTIEVDQRVAATESVGIAEESASQTEAPSGDARTRTGLRRPWLVFTICAVIAIGLGSYSGVGKLIWGEDSGPQEPPSIAVADRTDDVETPEQRDARFRDDVLGRWKTYYKGDRFMTIRPDGTATVEANLTDYAWYETLAVGTNHVVFEVEWSLEDGQFTFDTVGGEPIASVNFITDRYGKSATHPIVHVTEDEFRYQSDKDGEADYVWARLED